VLFSSNLVILIAECFCDMGYNVCMMADSMMAFCIVDTIFFAVCLVGFSTFCLLLCEGEECVVLFLENLGHS
jgi:hypothetical protein